MILDTSYLLPLARIQITSDLVLAVNERKILPEKASFNRMTVNSISIFELQAKAAKLSVNTSTILEAFEIISGLFRIESYNSPKIIEIASALRGNFFTDYIDCVIIATAVMLEEDLITEDSKILRRRKELMDMYNLKVLSYRDLTT